MEYLSFSTAYRQIHLHVIILPGPCYVQNFQKNLCSSYLEVLESTHKFSEGIIISPFLQDDKGIIKTCFSTAIPQQPLCTLLRRPISITRQQLLRNTCRDNSSSFAFSSCCSYLFLQVLLPHFPFWSHPPGRTRNESRCPCLNPGQGRSLLPFTLDLVISSCNPTTAAAQDQCKNTGPEKKNC